MTDLSLVIPVFRGAEMLRDRLPPLLGFLREQETSFEVVIVDDGSQDGSEDVLKSLICDEVRVLFLDQNKGKFGAIKAGMKAATGTCRMFTDADIPYEFEMIPHMLEFVRNGPFTSLSAIATSPAASIVKKWASSEERTGIFTLFVRLLVTSGLHDTQCGIKAFRGDVADAIFPLLQEEHFAGDVELLYIALSPHLAIRRVPARLKQQGPSSVNAFRDAFRMLGSIMRLRGRRRRGEYQSDALLKVADQTYWS